MEQDLKAQRGVELYLYYCFNLGARWGWEVNATPRPLYARERDSVPIVQEVALTQGSLWTAAENLSPTGLRSPDHPAWNTIGRQYTRNVSL